MGRVDDLRIAQKFLAEKEQIFVFALEGLRRLLKNNFNFTISAKTRSNIVETGAENCNIICFLSEEVKISAELKVTSVCVYRAYEEWFCTNGLIALYMKTFVGLNTTRVSTG